MKIVVLTVYLDIDGGKSVIQSESRASVHSSVVTVSSVIGMGQRMYLPECQERPETQRSGRMCIQQGVLYEQLLLVVQKEERLAHQDASDAVGDDGIPVELEVHYVLVSARLIIVLAVTADAEVEVPVMLDQGLVQR